MEKWPEKPGHAYRVHTVVHGRRSYQSLHICRRMWLQHIDQVLGYNILTNSWLQHRALARGMSGCLLDTLLLILDTLIFIILCIMQWDEKELDTQFTPNVHIWTPNSEILDKAMVQHTDQFVATTY